jgi:hypothetical protein
MSAPSISLSPGITSLSDLGFAPGAVIAKIPGGSAVGATASAPAFSGTPFGSDTPHNNMQPTTFSLFAFLKL